MHDFNSEAGEEWSTEERRQLAQLLRGRTPPQRLEERTLSALRQRGLLRRSPTMRPALLASAAGIAAISFIAGLATEYRVASRRVAKDAVIERTVRTSETIAETTVKQPAPTRQLVWY